MGRAWIKTNVGREAVRTMHLSTEEFGVYEILRRHRVEHGQMPTTEDAIAKAARVSLERWQAMRDVILPLLDSVECSS